MEIDREELLAVLNLVRPGLSQKEIIEQSNHFIFNKDEILAYNDELLISYPFDIGLQCTVDASLFLKLISRLSSDTIELYLEQARIRVVSDNTFAEIPIIEQSKMFDHISNVTKDLEKADWKKLSEDFIEGLRLCAFSAETDRTQGTLTCVRVEGQDIMSGSRNRVSWYKMDEKVEQDFYIEAALIEELSKYEDVTSYHLTKSWAHFRSEGGVTFSARRVIPLELLPFREPFEGFTDGVRIKIPDDLKNSIETVNLVNEGEQAVDKLVTLTVNKDSITTLATTEKGTISKEIQFEKPQEIADSFEVQIRPNFMMDVLDKTTFMYVGGRFVLFKRQAFQHLAGLEIK
jgi:hypothetical protein